MSYEIRLIVRCDGDSQVDTIIQVKPHEASARKPGRSGTQVSDIHRHKLGQCRARLALLPDLRTTWKN